MHDEPIVQSASGEANPINGTHAVNVTTAKT